MQTHFMNSKLKLLLKNVSSVSQKIFFSKTAKSFLAQNVKKVQKKEPWRFIVYRVWKREQMFLCSDNSKGFYCPVFYCYIVKDFVSLKERLIVRRSVALSTSWPFKTVKQLWFLFSNFEFNILNYHGWVFLLVFN